MRSQDTEREARSEGASRPVAERDARGLWRRAASLGLVLLAGPLLGLLVACSSETGTRPGTFRFGQDGQVRVNVVTPVGVAGPSRGTLEQTLTWRSTGEWRLVEEIRYRGEHGDSTVHRSQGDPGVNASSYASLITLVNESEGVRLFVEALDPDLEPECGPSRSRVTLRIRDERQDRAVEWTRCADGPFATLTPRGAGPDPAAGRVIQAARLTRDFVVGQSFRSAYAGTTPFATLARAEKSADGVPEPTIFLGADGQEPEGWQAFWDTHVGGAEIPVEVDWSQEMVIAATVGRVEEAGHEVEVRRILPVDGGTRIEVFHRIPGDFCSPAAGVHTPFHVVVAPRTTAPVRFNDQVFPERVPCGV